MPPLRREAGIEIVRHGLRRKDRDPVRPEMGVERVDVLFKAVDLRVTAKPDLTPVTDADTAVEDAIRTSLSRTRPLLAGESAALAIDHMVAIEACEARFRPARAASAAAYRAQHAQWDARVEEEARRLQKKIAKNQFDFDDFLSQIQQIKKMGNIKDLAAMIPGMGKALKDVDIDDNAFKGIEAIIHSMTPKERANPSVLNGSRKQRIAAGSGTTIVEVNRLLKQFDQTSKMMKMATMNPNKLKAMRRR